MSETYDCIVLGVGGFGSAALYHLARRGVRAVGIERFGIAHDRGSSHGETRIIRQAYFEHPDYVPLLKRAYGLWRELEAESQRELMRLCGLMLTGPPDGEAISGAKLAAWEHGVEIEDVAPAEARRRFRRYRLTDGYSVVFEPNAGYLHVEQCVATHAELAQRHGAVIKANETVTGWSVAGDTVRVRTDRNEYIAARMIVTAGAWSAQVLGDLGVALQVVRKPLFWYETAGRDYDVSGDGVAFYFETPGGIFYGFPSIDGCLVKVAEHSGGAPVSDPLHVARETTDEDARPVSEFVTQSLPGLRPLAVRSSVCMYTHTPDHHFLVDRHPEHANVVLGAGFSGHGFKFTSILGQALVDLALDGHTDLPIGFLSLRRFAADRT